MPRLSKIDRLPRQFRELIAELRQAHGWTIDQIATALRDLAEGRRPALPSSLPNELANPPTIDPDALPVRSGFGVHIQGLDQIAEKLHRTRAIAEALVRPAGEKESRLTELNVELMHSVVTDLVMAAESGQLAPQEGEDGEEMVPALQDPAKVMFLAKALDHLASAKKKDADTILKLRKEMQAELEKKVHQVKGEAAKRGLSADEALERVRKLYTGEA
jgi:hypothetical protein